MRQQEWLFEREKLYGKEVYQALFIWFWQCYLINPHKLKHPQESEGRWRYYQILCNDDKIINADTELQTNKNSCNLNKIDNHVGFYYVFTLWSCIILFSWLLAFQLIKRGVQECGTWCSGENRGANMQKYIIPHLVNSNSWVQYSRVNCQSDAIS